MLRWLLIFMVILAPGLGYMTWRAVDLKAPGAHVMAALPVRHKTPVDIAAATRHLSQAIEFPTLARADGDPRDPDTFRRFEEWIAISYPAIGAAATVERIADYSLLYTWTGSDPSSPPILLVAHLDVAAGGPGADDVFSGAIKDGEVWGRGAQIGKGPLIALLEAANGLAANGFKPRRTVIFAFGHDGDAGGEQGAAQIAKVLRARKLKAWFALDEGAPVVTAYAVTGKPAALIGITEKRSLNLLIRASARAGASAVRSGDPQAVTNVASAIVALDAMPNKAHLADEPTQAMMRALAPDMSFPTAFIVANTWAFEPLVMMNVQNSPGAVDLLTTTVSPTVIEGGANQTQRPSEASASVNVRLHPQDTPSDFLARARNVVAAFPGVTLDWAELPEPPIPTASTTSDAYRLIAALASQAGNGATAAPSLFIGSTDARHYTGVARDVYRFTPAIWTTDDIRNVMSPRERLSQKNLARMIDFYQALISEGAG